MVCSCSSDEHMELSLQVRLDLGLTSPQAQWLAKGGSGLSSGNLQGITEDPADAGGSTPFPDSPYKHRCALLSAPPCHATHHATSWAVSTVCAC